MHERRVSVLPAIPSVELASEDQGVPRCDSCPMGACRRDLRLMTDRRILGCAPWKVRKPIASRVFRSKS
jgi:hypothetical protein